MATLDFQEEGQATVDELQKVNLEIDEDPRLRSSAEYAPSEKDSSAFVVTELKSLPGHTQKCQGLILQ